MNLLLLTLIKKKDLCIAIVNLDLINKSRSLTMCYRNVFKINALKKHVN